MKGVRVLTDEQLFHEAFSKDDFAYVDLLISRYEDGLFGFCLKLAKSYAEAEELYQQTWLKVIQKRQTCSKSFKNWLYTVCLNTYRDLYRRSKRERGLFDPLMSDEDKRYLVESATDHHSAESEALKHVESENLKRLVNALPDKHRLPIVLHYFEGLDYEETARIMRLPIGTVKSRINSAKEKLRREMGIDADV